MRYIFMIILMLCTTQLYAQTRTQSVQGKVVPNFSNNSVDIYTRSGQKQTVPLYGVTVDPKKAAAANKTFIDKHKSQDYSNVRMYTDKYGQSRVEVNGQDIGRSLTSKKYAVPDSQCISNPGNPYCARLK